MTDKMYLDQAGLAELRDWILNQLVPVENAITILNKTDGTPGSIQKIVEDILKNQDILFDDELITFYGGSAENINDNDVMIFGGSAVAVTDTSPTFNGGTSGI